MVFRSDLRVGVLRILSNQGAVAVDPDTGKEVHPPALPLVAQPLSVLPPAGAALAHVRGRPLDLDVLGALGTHGVVNAAKRDAWLLLRPQGEPSEAERQAAADDLAAVLLQDEALTASSHDLNVELMDPPRGAGEHAKGIRVFFTQREKRVKAPDLAVPPTIPSELIIEHMNEAGELSGYVEKKEEVVFDEEGRHRTVIRTARLWCKARDPWRVWDFLSTVEARERVTVIEVRYSRDGYHLARAARDRDHGGASVKFAVRHPWISSRDLRERLEQTIAGRPAGASPTSARLQVRCSESQLPVLARLFSVKGVELRTAADGKLVAPVSSPYVRLRPSVAPLLRGLRAVFEPRSFAIVALEGRGSRLTLHLAYDLPKEGLGTGADAAQVAAEERLQEAWEVVVADAFLAERVGAARIQAVEILSEEDPQALRISASIEMHLEDAADLWRQVPAGSALDGEPLTKILALARQHKLNVAFNLEVERETRFRDGLLVVESVVEVAGKDLDLSNAERFIADVERLEGTSVADFEWQPGAIGEPDTGGSLSLTMTSQYPLWPGEPK